MTKERLAELQAEARSSLDRMDQIAEKFWKRYEDNTYYLELRTPVYARYGEDAVAVPRVTRTHKSE